MNLTAFRSHEFSYVKEELLAIREQVPSAIFKVIIEAPQLTGQEICQAVDLCVKGRADYVKTSTGWYPGCPSTVEQVRIMSVKPPVAFRSRPPVESAVWKLYRKCRKPAAAVSVWECGRCRI